MFCPRCSAENAEQQKYCRQCGLPLTGVQWILNGEMKTIIEKVKKGENALSGGAITLAIFVLVALINIFVSSGRSYGGAINLILGLLIAAPMIYIGSKRLERARKLIESESKPEPIASKQVKELPTAPITDRILEISQPSVSITEHTTYDLVEPQEPAKSPTPRMRQAE
jgi:hypothetical protein